MDIFTRLLLRAAIWARRPPPRRTILAVAVAFGVALLLIAVERYVGWPDWAVVTPHGFRATPTPLPR